MPGTSLGERRHVTGATMWPLSVFVVVAALLLAVTWPHVAAMNYEWGDFASNSLLVQRAKAFRLLHGNYSRVGFYHPGPAILYVLAAGEALFHDALGLTSPIGGQRIAVIIYTSAWVSLIAAMLARLFGTISSGLIATAVLVGATLYYLPEAFTGLWFPDLYYFPFAAFSVAVGLAIRGDLRFLPALAVSMGFLVNGHVSFASTTVVMIALGLVANAVLGRIGVVPREDSWWSFAFVARNWRRIGASAVLAALFLIPLLVDTILHYPGQVPAYLAYKSGHPPNSLSESVGFALSYFGSVPVAAAVVCAALILALRSRASGLRSGGAAALLAALLGALFATVLYARIGVDNLSEAYIAFYFYAAPALAFAGAAACLTAPLANTLRKASIIYAAVAATSFGWAELSKPLSYEYHFDVKYMPELYREVTALGPQLALDLDISNEGNRWSKVWFNIVGLEAYASRLGQKPFCIANHWHIVFSPAYRCSDEELASDRRLLVMADAAAPPGKVVLEDHDLSFVDESQPAGDIDRILRVVDDHQLFSASILGTGWSDVEEASVWSDGDQASLHVRAPDGAHRLKLDLDAFTPKGHVQRVSVSVDGGPARELVFDATQERRWEALDLPPGAGADHHVTLRFADPLSPKQAGLSDDTRRLGVLLYAIGFD